MKASNKKSLSVSSVITVVVLLAFATILSYMFIQPSGSELNESPSMQLTAKSDVVNDSNNVADEKREESNISLYEQTVNTVKKNMGTDQHDTKADNQYAALKTETKTAAKSSSSYRRNDEEQIYTYTQPEDDLYEPYVSSETKPAKLYKEYFKGQSIVVGSKKDNYNDKNSPNAKYEDIEPLNDPGYDDPVIDKPDEGNPPLYQASVERSVEIYDDSSVDVVLSINVADNPPTGMVIQEFIPDGWSLEVSDPKPKVNNSSGELKWLIIGKLRASRVFTYRVVRTGSPAFKSTFKGYLKFNDGNSYVESLINGEREI